jgi:hypothetical protein
VSRPAPARAAVSAGAGQVKPGLDAPTYTSQGMLPNRRRAAAFAPRLLTEQRATRRSAGPGGTRRHLITKSTPGEILVERALCGLSTDEIKELGRQLPHSCDDGAQLGRRVLTRTPQTRSSSTPPGSRRNEGHAAHGRSSQRAHELLPLRVQERTRATERTRTRIFPLPAGRAVFREPRQIDSRAIRGNRSMGRWVGSCAQGDHAIRSRRLSRRHPH